MNMEKNGNQEKLGFHSLHKARMEKTCFWYFLYFGLCHATESEERTET